MSDPIGSGVYYRILLPLKNRGEGSTLGSIRESNRSCMNSISVSTSPRSRYPLLAPVNALIREMRTTEDPRSPVTEADPSRSLELAFHC